MLDQQRAIGRLPLRRHVSFAHARDPERRSPGGADGVQVLAPKAGSNGYKSSEMEVGVAPGPSWFTTLTKDRTISLFQEVMTLLIEGGIKLEEMTHGAHLEVQAIEVNATKT